MFCNCYATFGSSLISVCHDSPSTDVSVEENMEIPSIVNLNKCYCVFYYVKLKTKMNHNFIMFRRNFSVVDALYKALFIC